MLQDQFEINRADVVTEVRALCEAYDQALISNDVPALDGYFWSSDQALRFGVTEELYGADEIAAFRKARVVNFGDRANLRETILTVGSDLALSNVEFSVTVAGSKRHGRQSQVWVRIPEIGWRIVSAHVSHRVTPSNSAAFGVGPAYGAAAAALLGLAVDPAFKDGVAANLDVMAKVVAPLMQLDLSDVEPAPGFTP